MDSTFTWKVGALYTQIGPRDTSAALKLIWQDQRPTLQTWNTWAVYPCWHGLVCSWQVVILISLSLTFRFKSHHLVWAQQLEGVGGSFKHVVLVNLPRHHVHSKLVHSPLLIDNCSILERHLHCDRDGDVDLKRFYLRASKFQITLLSTLAASLVPSVFKRPRMRHFLLWTVRPLQQGIS